MVADKQDKAEAEGAKVEKVESKDKESDDAKSLRDVLDETSSDRPAAAGRCPFPARVLNPLNPLAFLSKHAEITRAFAAAVSRPAARGVQAAFAGDRDGRHADYEGTDGRAYGSGDRVYGSGGRGFERRDYRSGGMRGGEAAGEEVEYFSTES